MLALHRLALAGLVAVSLSACGGGAASPSPPAVSAADAKFAAAMGPSIENAAAQSQMRGDYARALRLRQQVLLLAREIYTAKSEKTATALNNVGGVYNDMGRLDEAARYYKEAIQVIESVDGPKSLKITVPIQNLVRVFITRGEYTEVETYLNRLFPLQVAQLGDQHPDFAETALLFGDYLRRTGNCDPARVMFSGAEPIFEKADGPQSIRVAMALEGMGDAALCDDKYDEAQTFYERTLAIREKLFDREHPKVIEALIALGQVYRLRRDFGRAEATLDRALAAARRRTGPASQSTGEILGQLGLLAIEGPHDFRRAQALYAESLVIRQKADPEGPGIVDTLSGLSAAYWGMGDMPRAARALSLALDMNQRAIESALYAGPFAPIGGRLQMIWEQKVHESFAISFAEADATPPSRRAALLAILRRKGRILELSAEMGRVLRQHLAPARFDEFLGLKRSEAQIEFERLIGGRTAEQTSARAAPVIEATNRIQNEAGSEAIFRPSGDVVTVEKVASALPRDGVLVEIVEYIPVEPTGNPKEPSYCAFVVRPDASIDLVDLGGAKAIDDDVAKFRAALVDPKSDAKAVGRSLGDRVLRPLQAALGDARHVFIAPDNVLSVVPFGALVDDTGDYVVRHRTITMLTTGRELIRFARPAEPAQSGPVVVADPDFGDREQAPGAKPVSDRGVPLLAHATFPALPGTRREGQAVAAALGAKLLAGPDATDAAIAALHGPRVLHLATHGFLVHDDPASSADALSRGVSLDAPNASSGPGTVAITDTTDVMYRSGVVLAGANLHHPDDDGILTAAELAWLDLKGTELVVLSACETGLGATGAGGGVYGLQQSLLTAGARTLVMSLWKVDDAATSDLMADFYGGLAKGESRGDALRDAQLRIASSPEHAHPYYWASFVQYGDASPLRITAP